MKTNKKYIGVSLFMSQTHFGSELAGQWWNIDFIELRFVSNSFISLGNVSLIAIDSTYIIFQNKSAFYFCWQFFRSSKAGVISHSSTSSLIIMSNMIVHPSCQIHCYLIFSSFLPHFLAWYRFVFSSPFSYLTFMLILVITNWSLTVSYIYYCKHCSTNCVVIPRFYNKGFSNFS